MSTRRLEEKKPKMKKTVRHGSSLWRYYQVERLNSSSWIELSNAIATDATAGMIMSACDDWLRRSFFSCRLVHIKNKNTLRGETSHTIRLGDPINTCVWTCWGVEPSSAAAVVPHQQPDDTELLAHLRPFYSTSEIMLEAIISLINYK